MLRHARIAIASMLLIGCGSSAAPKDASGIGGIGGGTGAGGITSDGGLTGMAGLTGGGGQGGMAPATPTGSLVFTGVAAVLDCTVEEGATGDRWCAFLAASVSMPNNIELYVVNVSAAARGTSISCGLTDANCLRLTGGYVEDDLHLALFGGDTLVYYDDTWTPFGWRPGMAAARALAVADPSTMDVLLCQPDFKGTGVTCLRVLPMAMQTDPANILLGDLLAGRVDAAATPPLARVETIIAASAADGNVGHLQMGFPVPGGDTLAWSARVVPGGPEVLKTQTLGNDASRVTVASDVTGWSASPDGSRWYWLSQFNATTLAGTLQSAPFPGGASPVTIAANTLGYDFPTPTSLLVVDTQKQMLGFADPVGAPAASQVLDTGVVRLARISKQGHVAYAKTLLTSGNATFSDLFVKKSDGTGACTVTSTTNGVPSQVFFPSGSGAVAWIERATAAVTAQYTRLSDCMRMSLGTSVVGIRPIGDRAVLFADEFVSAAQTGTLRFRNVAAGNAISADPATQISRQVGTFIVTSAPTFDAVVYTVNGGSNDDGVYIRSFGP
jgi:hypothetical protein